MAKLQRLSNYSCEWWKPFCKSSCFSAHLKWRVFWEDGVANHFIYFSLVTNFIGHQNPQSSSSCLHTIFLDFYFYYHDWHPLCITNTIRWSPSSHIHQDSLTLYDYTHFIRAYAKYPREKRNSIKGLSVLSHLFCEHYFYGLWTVTL